MAKIYGVLGNIRGKAGGWVFSVLKGQQIMKEKSIPFNPQSSKQIAQRALFSSIVNLAKKRSYAFFHSVWNIGLSGGKTPFGEFMKRNLISMGETWDISKAVLSYGSLEPVYDCYGEYNTEDGETEITFDKSCFSNGELTDKVSVIFTLEDDEDVQWDAIDFTTRNCQAFFPLSPAGLVASNIRCHIFLTRGSIQLNTVSLVSVSKSFRLEAV